jgi:hypothetical protein
MEKYKMKSPLLKEKEMIENIINNFDFDRCLKVMEFLNWEWWCPNDSILKIPNMDELKESAKGKLHRAIEGCKELKKGEYSYNVSSGGFKASAFKNRYGHINFLTLEFILTEWEDD